MVKKFPPMTSVKRMTPMSEPIPPDDEPTPKPDPVTEELVAYLDGELDPSQAEVMATKLSLNPKLRAEADSLKRAWDVLDMLPKPKPSASFTAKTISQVLPANLVVTSAAEKMPAPATMLAVQPASISPRFPWILASVLVTFLGLGGGYFGRAILVLGRLLE